MLGETGRLVESATWTQTEPGCSVSYELLINDVDSGQDRQLTLEESKLVSFDSLTGEVTIENEDAFVYASQTWNFVLLITSDVSD